MEKLIFGIFIALPLLSFSPAHAEDGRTAGDCKTTECKTWKGFADASKAHGQSVCVGSFFAPESVTKFELQLYDGQGKGIFVNDAGVSAPRSAGSGSHRIGIGCSFIQKADKLIACIDGPLGQRTATLHRVNGKLDIVVAEHRLNLQFLDYN